MIRESFVMTGGRVDPGPLANRERRTLAQQTNTILEAVDGYSPGETRVREGNHLIVDRKTDSGIVHEDLWFTPALPLSIAEYPAEAQDRTFLTRYEITPDPAAGLVHVAKTQEKSLGEPDHPAWNIAP